MSDTAQGPGWWLASDGKWYPPELWTGPPNTSPPATPASSALGPTYGATGTTPPGQPGFGQPGYGVPGYSAGVPSANAGYGQGAPSVPNVQQKTNGLAVASLICGCAGLFFLPAILGIVFGFVARSQINRSNGQQRGKGLAIAGIIVGFGWLALVVLGIALGAGNHNTNSVIVPAVLLGPLGLGSPFNQVQGA